MKFQVLNICVNVAVSLLSKLYFRILQPVYIVIRLYLPRDTLRGHGCPFTNKTFNNTTEQFLNKRLRANGTATNWSAYYSIDSNKCHNGLLMTFITQPTRGRLDEPRHALPRQYTQVLLRCVSHRWGHTSGAGPAYFFIQATRKTCQEHYKTI